MRREKSVSPVRDFSCGAEIPATLPEEHSHKEVPGLGEQGLFGVHQSTPLVFTEYLLVYGTPYQSLQGIHG